MQLNIKSNQNSLIPPSSSARGNQTVNYNTNMSETGIFQNEHKNTNEDASAVTFDHRD